MRIARVLKRWRRRIIDVGAPLACGRMAFTGTHKGAAYENVDALVEHHFTHHSRADHVCRPTLGQALTLLEGKPAHILETGSSAWGTNSTLLLDGYVHSFGGALESVDIRLEPAVNLRGKCGPHTTLHCNDSVAFLAKRAKDPTPIDLVYLDSWDVDWKDPLPCAIHGLKEFMAISERMKPGTLLLIDDTPVDEAVMRMVQAPFEDDFRRFRDTHGFCPGKGALVKHLLMQSGRGRLIAHAYQLLWQF